jgi:hypothetical protein
MEITVLDSAQNTRFAVAAVKQKFSSKLKKLCKWFEGQGLRPWLSKFICFYQAGKTAKVY